MEKRQFKFRAWATDTKEMIPFSQMMLPEWFEDDTIIVMQFTGLLDKNGKEIYEGDVVKMFMPKASTKEKIIVVEFQIHNDLGVCGYLDPASDGKIIEVVGNIHENSELLTNS